MVKHSNLNAYETPTNAITENAIITLAKHIICFEKQNGTVTALSLTSNLSVH